MPNTQSTDNEASQLKAGHPPAVKVGNMRIVQRTHSTSSTSEDDKKADSEDATVPSACSFAPKTIIKGTSSEITHHTQPSVPEAVKQFHEKPEAKHENHAYNAKPNLHIQQPRK